MTPIKKTPSFKTISMNKDIFTNKEIIFISDSDNGYSIKKKSKSK